MAASTGERTLKVFDSMGQEVKPGEKILSFRGERAEFVTATRESKPGKSGKVVIKWEGSNDQREYYDNTFDLRVVRE